MGDEQSIRNAFVDSFGNRCIQYPVVSLHRDKVEGIRAAVEIAIMRSWNTLVLCPFSGFSALSSRYPNIDYWKQLVIIQHLNGKVDYDYPAIEV
jgi:hypothetical protein